MEGMPTIGDKFSTGSGIEWDVYLDDVSVPCVRLRRPTADGSWEYKDIPHSEWEVK